VPRRKQTQIAWEIIALGARGRLLGVVYAASEDEAFAEAIAHFDIRQPDKVRLLVRPV
jgi:hypothetical protein